MADSEQGPIADDHPPQEEEGKAEKEEPVAPPEQPQVEPQVEKVAVGGLFAPFWGGGGDRL